MLPMRKTATTFAPAVLALVLAACSGGEAAKPAGDGGKAEAKPAEGSDKGASAGEAAASAGPAAASAGPAASAGEAAATGGEAAASAGAPASAGDAAATGGEAAATGGDAAAGGDAITKLLDEVKAKKTKDERARKALEEAEAAGATPQDLAKAANARGDMLMGEPERATTFFEWARDKDPKIAEPSFNLAKMAALQGDIEATITHLTEVKKRGGKKLLKMVGYDPIFEVVKDDPKIQDLMR